MKFGKTYSEYIDKHARNRLSGCSYVEFKRLKKLLKKCPLQDHGSTPASVASSASVAAASSTSPCELLLSQTTSLTASSADDQTWKMTQKDGPCLDSSTVSSGCPSSCPGCGGKFFGELKDELAEVVGCFNTRAQQLLQLHLASGLRKYVLRVKYSLARDSIAMIQEGQTLVKYASMNAIAVRKILKKYDKVHHSNEGLVFRGRLLAMRSELMQSPWLIELAALHINLAKSMNGSPQLTEAVGEFSCDFDGAAAILSCNLLDSVKLDINLTCSICLDMLFDPVALGCGHLFCNSCACSAASVAPFLGAKAARRSAQCPLCRQRGVYADAVRLNELAILVSDRFNGYWNERRKNERKEQLKQAKDHYQQELQAFTGI
ncbi:hypothetical protein CY35_04G099600 [Sphagnum magellanicum]|nr:hypothetical protein CY35_04G099600 [Sphagnum magellanicum]KAH9565864.1 hypothetical protein CY35_04G099600 [Sphagnum magellanicum]